VKGERSGKSKTTFSQLTNAEGASCIMKIQAKASADLSVSSEGQKQPLVRNFLFFFKNMSCSVYLRNDFVESLFRLHHDFFLHLEKFRQNQYKSNI